MDYPKRLENVYVETLGDELCLYDWTGQKMHALNPTAALVWQQCDGQSTPAEIAARLQPKIEANHAEELVQYTLKQLSQAHLLAEPETPPVLTQRNLTRRELLKMAGMSLALLPVVKSIELPTALQACSANCTFSYFVNEIDQGKSCNEQCTENLITTRGELLCSADLINDDTVCRCTTVLLDPTADVCWGSDPNSNPFPAAQGRKNAR
ncbi:MAG: PqqD family protein [Anaerolineales bacterium]|nr:PqqD family protein [Anaerolineales bacterium]